MLFWAFLQRYTHTLQVPNARKFAGKKWTGFSVMWVSGSLHEHVERVSLDLTL